MGTFSTCAQSAFAQSLNARVETLSAHEQWLAGGILWGIATARVAGVAAKAICSLSQSELKSLVADVVAECELQCDVPRYLNRRFCPVVAPLILPEPEPIVPPTPKRDAIDEWFAAAIA